MHSNAAELFPPQQPSYLLAYSYKLIAQAVKTSMLAGRSLYWVS